MTGRGHPLDARRLARAVSVPLALGGFAGCADFDRLDRCRREPCEASPEGGSDAATSDGSTPTGGGEVFITGQPSVFALALGLDSGGNQPVLYWTTPAPNGAIASCPLAGCATPTVISRGGDPRSIAWSGRRAFWNSATAPTDISFVDDSGAVASIVATAKGVLSVAGGDTHNVFIEQGGRPMLVEWDFAGTSNFACSDCDGPADQIAAHANGMAWTSRTDHTIHFYRIGGTTAPSVIDAGSPPRAVALDSSSIYWATDDGRIRAAGRPDATSSAPCDVAMNLPEPGWLAVDDGSPFVYFSAHGTAAQRYADGRIGKAPKACGGSTTILATATHPEALVVSADHVYWAAAYDGAIRRVAK